MGLIALGLAVIDGRLFRRWLSDGDTA